MSPSLKMNLLVTLIGLGMAIQGRLMAGWVGGSLTDYNAT